MEVHVTYYLMRNAINVCYYDIRDVIIIDLKKLHAV